jgi:hypothetical protein
MTISRLHARPISASLRPFGSCLLLLAWLLAASAQAQEQPAKLVYIVRDGDTIVASNVLFSRSDTLRLKAQERVVREAIDNAVVVVQSNKRLIAYSVYTAAWLTMALKAGETVEKLEAEDYSAFVLTDRRILNFNGRSGVWSESSR